jgi:hypothetical protein
MNNARDDDRDRAVEIARRNALSWAHYVRSVYLPYLDVFSEVVLQWVAPAMSEERISAAANARESKAYETYPWSEYTDGSEAAELASDVGLIYYMTVRDVRWALLSMAAAALYHLVEQQVCELARLAFFGPDGRPLTPGTSVDLFERLGVKLTDFAAWQQIEELRHLANCVKHAEGNSCAQLRRARPDLFEKPTVGETLRAGRAQVRNPLMGDDIYVTVESFDAYVCTVRLFFKQLAHDLEQVGS